jgi:hypothetical protein
VLQALGQSCSGSQVILLWYQTVLLWQHIAAKVIAHPFFHRKWARIAAPKATAFTARLAEDARPCRPQPSGAIFEQVASQQGDEA